MLYMSVFVFCFNTLYIEENSRNKSYKICLYSIYFLLRGIKIYKICLLFIKYAYLGKKCKNAQKKSLCTKKVIVYAQKKSLCTKKVTKT